MSWQRRQMRAHTSAETSAPDLSSEMRCARVRGRSGTLRPFLRLQNRQARPGLPTPGATGCPSAKPSATAAAGPAHADLEWLREAAARQLAVPASDRAVYPRPAYG